MPNLADSCLVNAERDASPLRMNSLSGRFDRSYSQQHVNRAPDSDGNEEGARGRQREEVEEGADVPYGHRHGAASSSVSSVSSMRQESRSGLSSRPDMISRSSTKMEADMMAYLERHPTAIQRVETQRLQHQITVGSTLRSRTSNKPLPSFGGGKPYPPLLPEREEYVVEFEGQDDPLHAQNWPLNVKIYISAILIFDSLAATLASSILSNAGTGFGKEFNVGVEVQTLATSLFVLGYAFGPIIWAPLSELFGRRVPIIIAAFGFGVFGIAVAVAKDIQTIMICRFFSGLFGSCPLAVVAAVFADMYNNQYRGLAIASFSATVFMGPVTGPFIGGFISTSYLGWRFTAYIPAFMGFGAFFLTLFFQKESYGPIILVEKAAKLRRMTRNWGIHAKQDEVEVDLRELLVKNVSRPLRILFTEPIVLLVTIYMSFLYGLLYLFLTAYSLVFENLYGWSPGVAGLPYFGFITGEIIGFIVVVYMNKGYTKKLAANNDVPVPEWRLPIVMVGGISFTIGIFWFGWTGYLGNDIPWIVPTLSGLASGFGIFTVFLQLLNYIIDAYLMFAASAIAANTFMRSIFGAVFPLFAIYMFDGIGINYGMTLLGCVSALLVPMPFLFYIFGRRIRAKSKFAPALDIEQDKQRARDEEMGEQKAEDQGLSGSGESEESRSANGTATRTGSGNGNGNDSEKEQ